MEAVLSREVETFERERERLEREHNGKYVLIHDDEVIGIYEDFDSAAKEGIKKFGDEPFLLRRIGEPQLELPASIQYGLTVAHS